MLLVSMDWAIFPFGCKRSNPGPRSLLLLRKVDVYVVSSSTVVGGNLAITIFFSL